MIWATVSSRSCLCWLYRASPSLAEKNIISLISVLTIWWCPCVKSCVVGRGCLLRPVHSLVKILLLSASFCTPRSNLPVYSRYFFLFFFTLQYCIGFAVHQHDSAMVYTCSQSWTRLPPPSPYHPSGSSQCTSPYSRYFLTPYFCIPAPSNEKDIFFGC